MRRHKEVAALIKTAQAERRCVFGSTSAQRQALARRVHAKELHRAAPNMYADVLYWQSLDPPERTLHLARAMHVRHDSWRFGGITAAAAHGFEHQWSLHDGTVTVLTATKGTVMGEKRQVKLLRSPSRRCVTANGIPVTDGARTVVDCGLLLGFRDVLPIMDSALAKGVTVDDVLAACSGTRRDYTPIFQLLRYANPLSENGGESLARATMIEQRFMIPQIQVAFTDPDTGKSYRVDFVWRLADGRIVVGEFDGTQKYVDPGMANRRSIQGVVLAEREREAALRRAGVTAIVRFTFDDVVQCNPLCNKLLGAGVPCMG
ncbi:hypothetical protein [Bifidobacterium parmae]|uniref:CTP synthase n=1 Tax=Bifidobacterium parmae TaxID=361854 RepID=A0A2N5J3L8_9BIFI|nr:hypothetical protein [Bifidobacterium parmae]PLS28773.1 hypothetical protein Uis4E_1137 [Bifidobacterium parmae]